MNTSVHVRQKDALLVDTGAGVVLQAPPTAVVSRAYAEAHKFVCIDLTGSYVLAGPDADSACRLGAGGKDVVIYHVDREVTGFLHLTRES